MPDPTVPYVVLRKVRGPLDADAAQEVRALAARAQEHDGVAPLSEQPLLWLTAPEAPVVHLLAHAAPPADPGDPAVPADVVGTLVGYAQLDVGLATTARGELVVDPTHRRTGVGRLLVDRALREAAAEPGRRLHVWAHGDLPPARSFAGSTGLAVVRELWQMSLDLDAWAASGPRPGLPAGVAVRTFVPGQDEETWRRLNSRAFAHHPEQGRMTSADLHAREAEPWFDPAGFLLAERDGTLLASVWTKVHPAGEHGDEPVGEIYVVGVDPDAQGLGLGSAMTAAGLEHLVGRGLHRAILYTGAENTVAVHTYERAGFVRSAVDVMFGTDTAGSPADVTMAP